MVCFTCGDPLIQEIRDHEVLYKGLKASFLQCLGSIHKGLNYCKLVE